MSFKNNDFDICVEGWRVPTVNDLIAENVLDKPMDGNHGGIHPKSTDYVESGIPFIMANDLAGGSIDFQKCKFISYEQSKLLKKGRAKNGDVLLTHKGTIGRTALLEISHEYIMLTPQVTYYRVIDDTVLSNLYLKYYFDSNYFQSIFSSWAQGGSTRAYVGITDQRNLPIVVPPLQEQKAIAHILSTLDEKIEVNNKINKTLEEMAQAIFKHWFVEFEFPNEDGEPYKSSGGEMVDSELGPIPKGWEVGKVGSYMKVKSGFAFKSQWWADEGIPVVKIKNLSNGVVDYNDVGYVSADKVNLAKDFIVKSGDILIAMTGATIGKIGLVYEFNNTVLVNQRVGKFFIGDDPFIKLPFAYVLLTNKAINEEIISLGGGSAQPNVSPSQIENIKIPFPTDNKIEIYNELLNSSFRKLVENIKENERLKQIRDTLLPKLMSGEIRVPIDNEQ